MRVSLRSVATVVALIVSGPVSADSLASAFADAYEHSGLLEQNRALLRAADEDVAQAAAALMPVINWAAEARATSPAQFSTDSLSTTASASLLASYLLFDGGRSQMIIDAQKETVLATRAQLVAVEQQVLQRALFAYMQLRREQAFLDLRRNNVRVITQELRAAKDRFEVGESTNTDVALAEARLAAARSAEAGAEGSVLRAIEEFRAAIGRRPGTLQIATGARLNRTPAEAEAIALRTHPDLRNVQHQVQAAELGIEIARLQKQPSVNLEGRYTVTEGFEDSASVAITAGGPIYTGGRLDSIERQAIANRDGARARLHLARHAIRQGIADAYANLNVSRASRDAFERQVRAAQVAFRGAREEASLGSRTTLDVLNAEQELLDARANLISAQVDEVIASYNVLAAMGLLTAEQLNLNVQIYDPTEYYKLVEDAPTARSAQGQALDRVLQAIGD